MDLGCGPGNSTELLLRRYPQAHLLGIDSSQAMLATARERLPSVAFERGDISNWTAAAPVELLFANAALQWVSHHEQLLPRLLSMLAPGGVLAVQMPDNLDEPSHRLMREVAADARFAAAIGDAAAVRAPLLSAQRYYDLLVARAQIDLWRTTYFHDLENAAAIVQWLSATGLRPFLQPLTHEQQTQFLEQYERRLQSAYPPRANGRCLLAFPRLFLLAQRR